ncbi:MAG: hypothetical protein KGO92_10715 [Bacteroidota bacterium]|nr:hypothetical protein [Bacteroidota bacterium]
MRISRNITFFSLVTLLLLGSCSTRKLFSKRYYLENEKALTAIEQDYKAIYAKKAFSLGFTDRSFNTVSVEIITDSLKYIYDFEGTENRMQDTLLKYGLPVKPVMQLIRDMRSIKCIWINNLDYYVNNQKRQLVFMSIRPVSVHLPFSSEKYYILSFYAQPQYFDSEGLLLDNRKQRKLRKVNGEIFHRINDKVCYTISGSFR